MKIDLGCTMEQLVEAVNEASAAPSNMVTTDSAQTISGAKTFTKTTTFQNDIKANGSAGTSGQVLVSQGSGNSPKWGDVPAPSNVVTTDTEQAISGVKRFVSNSNPYPQTIINSNGMGIQSAPNELTGYSSTSILRVISGHPATINLPSSAGTLALTSDIPTLYLAQGIIVTQGGDSFYTPAIPCTNGSIDWIEYYALFPERVPVNITYRSVDDVILVTSISIGTESGVVVITSATETNLTTGVVTEVTGPQDYSLDEILTNSIYA